MEEKIFTTTKKALLLQDSHSYMERREALDRRLEKATSLLSLSLCVSLFAMIPLGFSHIGTYLGFFS